MSKGKYNPLTDDERKLFEELVEEEERTGYKPPSKVLMARFPGRTEQDICNHRNLVRRRRNNQCSGCKAPVKPGTRRCKGCRDKRSSLAAKRKAAGLCVACGKTVDLDGTACYCSACAVISRKSNKQYIKRLTKAKKPVSATPGEPVFMFPWVNTKAGKSVTKVLPSGYRVVDLCAGTGSLAVRAARANHPVLGVNDVHPLVVNFLDVVVNGDLASFADHVDHLARQEPQCLLGLYEQAGQRRFSPAKSAAVFYLMTKNTNNRNLATRVISKERLSGMSSSIRKLILEVRYLLQGALITSLDCMDAIEVYDRPDTLFLVDPPWPGSSQMFEFNIDGRHADLMKRLASLQGEAIVMLQSNRRGLLLARHMPYAYFRQVYASRELLLSTIPLPFGDPIDLDSFGV